MNPFSRLLARVLRHRPPDSCAPSAGRRPSAAQWLAAAALYAFVQGASAATPPAAPGTIEQRVAACIACHGREGASSNAAYYPRLAGKPERYLYEQLRSFRDGRRFQTDMTYLIRHLSDDYLREMARYFAGLDLPYPKPSASAAAGASTEVLARGQTLVREGDAARDIPACTQCHGQALTGALPGIPGLVGLPRLYIASQLGDWLTNSRHALPPDCMADVGRRLTTADIQAISNWLALQPVPADTQPVAALPAPLPARCSVMEE